MLKRCCKLTQLNYLLDKPFSFSQIVLPVVSLGCRLFDAREEIVQSVAFFVVNSGTKCYIKILEVLLTKSTPKLKLLIFIITCYKRRRRGQCGQQVRVLKLQSGDPSLIPASTAAGFAHGSPWFNSHCYSCY